MEWYIPRVTLGTVGVGEVRSLKPIPGGYGILGTDPKTPEIFCRL